MLVSTFFELFVDLMEQLVVGGQKPLFCKKIYIIYTIVLETIQMNKKKIKSLDVDYMYCPCD